LSWKQRRGRMELVFAEWVSKVGCHFSEVTY
jgi:hypothetical protein